MGLAMLEPWSLETWNLEPGAWTGNWERKSSSASQNRSHNIYDSKVHNTDNPFDLYDPYDPYDPFDPYDAELVFTALGGAMRMCCFVTHIFQLM